ncbi:ABC transporter substrate-binding protein [Salsuginibacillus kocurii]|uniref:ABC transporter substrate-binding protein n=1 Tax=Salsuginibacillus kocurii TaxID=427078 RepID=UPI000377C876|nr:ABC transporter substrate-binding protein [Salsuginibacillus kocurii]
MSQLLYKRLIPGSMALSLLFVAACGEEGADDATGAEEEGSDTEDGGEEIEEVDLVLNWFPKSQQGGFFAAQSQGYFEENGLGVNIEPGGPEVSSVQMVSSGSTEFGLAHADQILIAIDQGADLVALSASLQNSPQAMMFHEGEDIEDFEDMNGRTAYVESGIPYWDYLNEHYDLSGVDEQSYSGEHATFANDTESVSQSFVTSEPYFMEREGIDTETLLVSESGFDPYNVVLFVEREYLDENEEAVAGFMEAFEDGWDYYAEEPEEVNEVIHEADENIALDELEFETETQEEFVYEGDAAEHGVGHMDVERWSELIEQLEKIDVIGEGIEAEEIFTTDYLSGS